MLSLTARLLIAASVVLLAFLGMTGWILDQAFRESARSAVRDRLQAQVYILLGAAELDAQKRLSLPRALPEARFSTPGSGLYAEIVDNRNRSVWRSDSMLGIRLSAQAAPERPGAALFSQSEVFSPVLFPGDEKQTVPVFVIAFAVSWEVSPDQYRQYTFRVIETRQAFQTQVSQFGRSLWSWLLGVTLVLLAAQGLILRWSLQPLRKVAAEVNEIENGAREELSGQYPDELKPLTVNLNNLVRQSRNHLERYRNALGDLAHSLKTPLAVLQGLLAQDPPVTEIRAAVATQLERMNQTVNYQLQRAAASGRPVLSRPVPLAPVVQKVLDSLAKVYADKKLTLNAYIDPSIVLRGDEGDLLEIVGNLGDNACKWARSTVVISARERNGYLTLCVQDDGPGIADEQKSQLLQRGLRADENIPGHGIGLAIVRDIVEEVYRGELEIGSSELGGALLRVKLKL